MIKNILCFGDSLTAGYYNKGKNYYPYAKKLEKLLEKKNIQVDYIGMNGWSTDEMLIYANYNICKDAMGITWNGFNYQLQQKRYDYCIILAGTNDLYESENFIEDLVKIHKIAQEFGCKTIALTIPFLKFECVDSSITDLRLKANNEIKNKFFKYFKKDLFSVVDIEKELPIFDKSKENIWDSDGMHFNPKGYDLIAKIIFDKIKDY